MNGETETQSEMGVAKALWFPSAGHCVLREEALGPLAEHEVRIRTRFSGISRGTEALVFSGKVPVSEYETMRGPHMEGDFSFPVKYGYAAVGRVEAGPASLLGRDVFCLHPHQTRFQVSAEMVHPLPEGLPPARAVLTANMETALNIVWDANILPGDRVAVFGAGVVGALTAYIVSNIIGTEVTLVDPNENRARLAHALDIEFAPNDALEWKYDVLINASASASALSDALKHADFEARIVEASWYGDRAVTLPLGGAFHAKRLSIIASQVGHVANAQRARFPYARRLAIAMELLRDDRLDALISGETAFNAIDRTFPDIINDPETLCHRISYEG